jgi:hypothetical protein
MARVRRGSRALESVHVPDWPSVEQVVASGIATVVVRLTWGFCCVWFERSRRKTQIALERERRKTRLTLERERRKRPRQQLAEARPPPPRRQHVQPKRRAARDLAPHAEKRSSVTVVTYSAIREAVRDIR